MVGLKHPSVSFQELQGLRDLESRLLIASGILQSSMVMIEGIEACCRSLVTPPPPGESSGKAHGENATNTSSPSELQFLTALGAKCRGYCQSADLIKRRVNLVIGLVRIFDVKVKKMLTTLRSSLMASTSKARRRRTISLTPVMH